MAFDELTLVSFIWENTMRAADAVAPNVPYSPEERLPMRDMKPLARSKGRCRRRGTQPRHDADCGRQWRFLCLRACAAPRILGGVDIWRIDGLLTQNLHRTPLSYILDTRSVGFFDCRSDTKCVPVRACSDHELIRFLHCQVSQKVVREQLGATALRAT